MDIRDAHAYLVAAFTLLLICVALGKGRSSNGIGMRGDTQAGTHRRAISSNRFSFPVGAASLSVGASVISNCSPGRPRVASLFAFQQLPTG
jgi:hypothetical protein